MRVRSRILASVAIAATLALSVFASSCKSQSCVPGQQIACACPGGAQGVQACDVDGSRYLRCDCTPSATQVVATQTAPQRRPKQIRCGSLTCDVACCATFNPPTCTNDPRSCPRTDQDEAVIYECDGPEDCLSGQSCCLVPGKTVIGAVCVPRDECKGTIPNSKHGTTFTARKVCHANTDCDVSELCTRSADSTGIMICSK